MWVDGYVGSRLRYEPAGRCICPSSATLAGRLEPDVGSRRWCGYDLSRCCVVTLGYRHLDVDYESSEFVNDLYMTGPILGFSWRF